MNVSLQQIDIEGHLISLSNQFLAKEEMQAPKRSSSPEGIPGARAHPGERGWFSSSVGFRFMELCISFRFYCLSLTLTDFSFLSSRSYSISNLSQTVEYSPLFFLLLSVGSRPCRGRASPSPPSWTGRVDVLESPRTLVVRSVV